jgi:hypothetical protein
MTDASGHLRGSLHYLRPAGPPTIIMDVLRHDSNISKLVHEQQRSSIIEMMHVA